MLTPLLTLPYMARILGLDGLGLLATATAVCTLFAVAIDWGFNLTGVRAVSVNRHDSDKLCQLVSTVLAAKIIISVACLAALALAAICFETVRSHIDVFLLTFLFVATQSLVPTWVFQGLERLDFPAVVTTIGKLTFAVLLFTFVRSPSDVAAVPLINLCIAATSLLATSAALRKRHHIKWARPSYKWITKALRDGRAIFLATAAGLVYSQGPIILLNWLTDLSTVGKYSIAQKISVVAVSAFQSYSQAIFPSLSLRWVENPRSFASHVTKYIAGAQAISLCLLLTLCIFAPQIYFYATTSTDAAGINAIHYWLAASQFIVLSVTINPALVALGRDQDLAKMYMVLAALFAGYSWYLTQTLQLKGMLIAILIAEASIGIASVAILWHRSRPNTQVLT